MIRYVEAAPRPQRKVTLRTITPRVVKPNGNL
jgi:hypothetical protein